MPVWLERTKMLFSEDAVRTLQDSSVIIFGIGGVGGYVAEALARGGIGKLVLIDNDKISESNLNRQIVATTDKIGEYKTAVMRERILLINPQAQVQAYNCFYLPGMQADFLPLSQYDYVVDAIDTISAKIDLAVQAQNQNFRLISSMGTGNKLDPTAFQVADIYQTKVCPLARVMRKELRDRNIKKLKVVYSQEEPIKPVQKIISEGKRSVPGSVSFVPSVAGLIIAGEVMKELIGCDKVEE